MYNSFFLSLSGANCRFLCLPTSRMQCLMVLPFLDAVFSTKRDDPDSGINRTEYSVPRKLSDLSKF